MLEDFKTAMKGVKKHLFGRTKPNNYLIVGEKIGNRFSPKMDHLVCFLPGTIALAHSIGQLDEGLDKPMNTYVVEFNKSLYHMVHMYSYPQ